MSSGKSSSSSSSQTSSVNEDNRIVAEGGGVALGKDAIMQINDYFGENVLDAFKELVGLTRDAGDLALQTINAAGEIIISTQDRADKQSQNTVAAVTGAIAQDKAGTTGAWSNMVPLLIGAVVLIVVFGMITGRR